MNDGVWESQLTKHLPGLNDAIESAQNVADRWVPSGTNSFEKVERVQNGPQGRLIRGCCPKADNAEIFEHDAELSSLMICFTTPYIDGTISEISNLTSRCASTYFFMIVRSLFSKSIGPSPEVKVKSDGPDI